MIYCIPKLNLFIGGTKKVTEFIHFIALSVHDNNIFGNLSSKNVESIDLDKAACVEAIASSFDSTNFDSVSAMAKGWIEDRRNKEYPVFPATKTSGNLKT